MKVLVLGGSGFIGKSLVEYLNKKGGYKVLSPKRQELNLLNKKTCKDYLLLHKPERIIHCAVNINSVEETLRAYYNIASLHENFGKLYYLGSGAEYNPLYYKPLMKETYSPVSFPDSDYAFAKWIIGNDIERQNINKVINLRLFAVYGMYENFSRRFISNNICRVLSGASISMNQDIKFDFIYIKDLCEYLCKILTFETISFKTFNICSGQPVKLSYLAGLIRDLMDVEDPVKILKSGEQSEYSGNPSRAIKE